MSKLYGDLTSQQLLHFPFMTLPSGEWLRQGLLYWDGMAVFADERWAESLGSLSPDIAFLRQEGFLHAIDPGLLIAPAIVQAQDLRNEEIRALIETPLAKAFKTTPAGEAVRTWFADSVTLLQAQVKANEKGVPLEQAIKEHLEDVANLELSERVQTRLANRLGTSVDVARRHGVLRIALHWGLLVRDFSSLESGKYLPSTDAMLLGELLYSPVGARTSENALGLILSNAFPIPAGSTRIEDVLRFKERNCKQYSRFHLLIDEVAIELESVGNPTTALRRLRRFVRDMDLQRHELAAKLRRRKLDAVLDTVDVVLKTDTSPFLETIGRLAFASEIPPWWKAAALGAPLVLRITKHAIRERNAIANEMNASPVAYLHSAKRRGMFREAFPLRRMFRKARKKLSRRGAHKKGV